MTRRTSALLMALLLLTVPLTSAPPPPTFEALTVTDTAGGFTESIYKGQSNCLMRNAVAEIRYRADGTAASATVGQLMQIGDVRAWSDTRQLALFSAIRTGGTSGILTIECYPQ